MYWELVLENGELVWQKHVITDAEREEHMRKFAEAKAKAKA